MTPKQFFFIIMGVIVLTVGAGGYGYVYALSRVETAKTNLASALGQQTAYQTEIDNLNKMKQTYLKEVKPELPLMDAALPRTKNQTQLLEQLQTLASNAGLSLGAVNFPSPAGLPTATSQTVASGTVLALPATFNVEGSFQQLQTFLIALENLNRFTNVTTLTVSRSDKSKPINYSITLNAFVKP